MEINQEKLARQQEGKELWRRSGGKGTLWYEMGVGKTYTAVLIMNELLRSQANIPIYIIVPSDILKQHWTKGIDYHLNKYKTQITIYTRNEIVHKIHLDNCGLVIIDEIHEFATGNGLEIVAGHYFKYKYILGLTGTWIIKDNLQRNLIPYCPVVDRIDELEARKHNFISDVIEYNLSIELTQSERNKYQYYNEQIEKYQKIFNKEYISALKCIKDKKLREEIALHNGWTDTYNKTDLNKKRLIEQYNPNKIYQYAIEFISIVSQRMQLVYKASNKIEPIIQLCKKYSVKTIIFSENTEFADRIFHELNYQLKYNDLFHNTEENEDDICTIYHSNLQTQIEVKNGKTIKIGKIRLKKRAIENISTGKNRILVTSKALDRGLNIEDLRLGINVSSTQVKNQHKQRSARINRIEIDNPNILALMVNIYTKDTVEEKWLKNKQRGSVNMIKFVNSVEQINHKFEKEN